jgi:hypothetical protein
MPGEAQMPSDPTGSTTATTATVSAASLAAGLVQSGTIVFIDNTVQAQAGRLYQAAFGRAPDDAGVAYWSADLSSGDTLTNVASGFLASAEFQARYGAPNSTALVTSLYQNVLHRAPDAAGLAYWRTAIDSGGLSEAQVLVDFSESPENKANTPTSATAQSAARIYYTVLDRAPDTAGLTFWTSEISRGELGLADEADSFVKSAEFASRYGNLSDAAFVNQIYENALGRPADSAGLGAWGGLLANGGGRYNVVMAISESSEAKARFASVTDGPSLLVTA